MTTRSQQQLSVLVMSTLAFTVCFAVWMMFAVIGIPIKTQLGLNETQFGILIATPVLTGSLIRLPLGMWTDKFGGRIVFFFLMLSTVGPIWLMEFATEFWHFLTIGLFVGMAGGSFSVGIAYCARWILRVLLGRELDAEVHRWVYVGDSTNDQLMFGHFAHSVGVANIRRFEAELAHKPRYITRGERGAGFIEVADALLATRS